MESKNFNKHLLITIATLLFVVFIFEFGNLDIVIQNHFYNIQTQKWLLSKDEPIAKFIFYDGIKKLLILFLVSIFFCLIFLRKKIIIQKYKQGLIIVLCSGILVPAIIGALKAATNIPCPRNIVQYGGDHPHIKVFEKYSQDFKQSKRMKCWPAGHASGGFALLSLFFLFKSRKNKKFSILFALTIGWIMGIHKMLIGDHFLSHTIVTMIVAWLIILIIAKFFTSLQKKLK